VTHWVGLLGLVVWYPSSSSHRDQVFLQTFKEVVESAGLAIDAAGDLAILIGLILATVRFVAGGHRGADAYRRLRHDLARRSDSALVSLGT
jgi:D-serine dehydratase